MSNTGEKNPVSLNKQLVTAVIELIDFYSKKGVFKVKEYTDIASINDRLTDVFKQMETGDDYKHFTSQELGFIILIFKEGSSRIPTSIDSFGQIYSIYQHYQTLLEQTLQAEKDLAEKKKEIPTVEELEA